MMASIVGLLLAVFLTLLVNRIATAALTFTGMSHEMARFQARSALCTVGYTTTEAEQVVNHPVRRRIIGTLMLIGNMGFITIIATSLSSLQGLETEGGYAVHTRVLVLVSGLAGLWALGMSHWVDRNLFRLISWALRRWTHLDVHDYRYLLQLGEGYNVTELKLNAGDWLVGKRLMELRLGDIGVNVLGIHRMDGEFVGSPIGSTFLRRGDRVIVYGDRAAIAALDEAKAVPADEEKHFHNLNAIQAKREQVGEEKAATYCVAETQVDSDDWAAGRKLSELAIDTQELSVLGIERADGAYIEKPAEDTPILAGDRLIMYGGRNAMSKMREAASGPEEAEGGRGVETRKEPR